MTLDYLIYDLESGQILRSLSCPAGLDRKANVRDGEGAVLAGEFANVPDMTHKVDLATMQIVPKGL